MKDFREVSSDLRILVATYFEELGANLPTALGLPVAALHLDLVRAPATARQGSENYSFSFATVARVIDGTKYLED